MTAPPRPASVRAAPRRPAVAPMLWAFLVRDLKNAASYRLLLFVQITSVLTLTFTFFFLALMLEGVEHEIPSLRPYGGRYFGFALVGLAVSGFLDAALRSFSTALRQAQMTGTFAAMLATRAPLGALVAGSALYTLLFTTFRAGLFFALGATLFGLPVDEARWGAAFVILALTVGVTGVLGIFAAGFVVRFKQGDPVTAGLAGLSWLFSGVVYPKEIFPAPVQTFAEALPLTHCLEAMRGAVLTGTPLAELSRSVTYLGGFILFGLPLALGWFTLCVRGAKRAGTLSQY